MTATEEQNGHVHSLSPPTDRRLEVKDKTWLVLQIIWLTLLVVPHFLLEFYRTIFPPPGKSLKGQVALVTGAGRGLGRGLALRLAKEGCKVAVVDIDKNNAMDATSEIVSHGGVAKAYLTNVVKVEDIRELRAAVTKDLGPVDILVNNAGLVYGDSLDADMDKNIKAVIAVNLMSHFWIVREFLPVMKQRDSGHIVAVASVAAMAGIAKASSYVASKFGVRGFMETVRAELVKTNIKTTTVCPYFINTSAFYTEHWDIRLPEISIDEAVEATITGIKREKVFITIPGYLQFFLNVMRLMPQSIIDKATEIFYVRIISLTQQEKESSITNVIAKDLVDQDAI